MGIDIYLGGYEEFDKRIKRMKEKFHEMVKTRDSTKKGSFQDVKSQKKVDQFYEEIYCGKNGYLRSSYNSEGIFNVYDEIFGFDVATWLFPEPWNVPVEIDPAVFKSRIGILQRVTVRALAEKKLDLPWIEIFTEVSEEHAPLPEEVRAKAEEYGRSVRTVLLQHHGAKAEDLYPHDREESPKLTAAHGQYLLYGMRQLADFGELAEKIVSKTGQKVYAAISY